MNLADQIAFDLGWDFAVFDRDVPAGANKAFCDGYRAHKKGHKRSTRSSNKYERKWLQIRYGAFSRKKVFSSDITPEYLEKITPQSGACPVTLMPLTFAQGELTDWSVDRANNDRGYVHGNLIVISTLANTAKSDKSLTEILELATYDSEVDGLLPAEWARMAELVEPAFGENADDDSPVPILMGQNVALGMPISPIASFQVAISRVIIDAWHEDKREFMDMYNMTMFEHLCRSKKQQKAYIRLVRAVRRRSKHITNYSDIWATKRVQRRLFDLVNTFGSAGLMRLTELQGITVGNENARIA